MLYLEDELGAAQGYADVVSALEHTDGLRVYHPDSLGPNGCQELPLGTSRDDIRGAGANAIVVGNCAAGWSADVFSWDHSHVESGSTPAYRPFPACDASYGAGVYASELVRYFEDSTWLSAAVDPAQTPADHQADALTPDKVTSMVDCGVNLFGFDQFEPQDGRVEASIWSWAGPGEQQAAASECAVQRADGRWVAAACDVARPAACRAADGTWSISAPATHAGAAAACAAEGAAFALPRTGLDDSRLRQAAGSGAGDVLLAT